MTCPHSTSSDPLDSSNPQYLASDLSHHSEPLSSPPDRASGWQNDLSDRQHILLRLAACCHHFDRAIMQAIATSSASTLIPAEVSNDDWNGLTQLPIVDPVDSQEGIFQLSEDVRHECHQALWTADAERWHNIHGVLADDFQERSHTIIPPDASPKRKYENEKWRSLTTEYLYHLILSERPGYQTIVLSHVLEADNLDTFIWTRFYRYQLDYQHAVGFSVRWPLFAVQQEFEPAVPCPLSPETLAFCRDFGRFDRLHSLKQKNVQRIRQYCLDQLNELEGLAKFVVFMIAAKYGPASEQLGWLNQAYEQAVSCLFPDDPELNWYMVGRQLAFAFYYDAGAHTKAIECHNRAVEYHPDNPAAWHDRGVTLSRLERSEEAIASYDKAIECDSEYSGAWQARGNELYTLGHVEEALDSYKQTGSDSQPLELEDTWRSIAEAMHRWGRSKAALALYDNALEINAENANSWKSKADILYQLGRKEEAVFHYSKAAACDPQDARWPEKQSEILEELGRNEDAKTSYEQVVIACDKAIASRSHPGVSGLWGKRGRFLIKLERYEEAIASYDQVIGKNSRHGISYQKQRAWILEKLGRKAEAIAGYKEALACCDKILEDDQGGYRTYHIWRDRAELLVRLNRHEEAIASYDNALEYQYSSHKLWLDRGEALATLNRYEEAIAMFDRTMELEPDTTNKNHTDAVYNKACCFSLLGNVEQAITHLEQAIQLNSHYRDRASKDNDFATLNDHPEFQRLTS